MSNVKGTRKPLKGVGTLGQVAYISADQIVASSISVPGLINTDGLLENVIINNAVINNTQIGVENPNVGYFTILQSGNEGVGYTVLFYGYNDDYVLWDPDTAIFEIAGALQVRDCSLLGNIRICENVISSELTDQDIIIRPNGIGDLQLEGGFEQRSSIGSFATFLPNGQIVLSSGNDVRIASSNSSVTLDSRSDLLLSTVNGDIIIRPDTGIGLSGRKFFSSIIQDSPGVIRITTTAPHNLTTGDTVVITSTNSIPSINGTYTVVSVGSLNTFTIPGGISASGTSGIVTRTSANDVLFEVSTGGSISLPVDIPLRFGPTNAITGRSSGILVSTGSVFIPQDTVLAFSSRGSLWVDSSSTLNIDSISQVLLTAPTTTVSGNTTLIDTPNVRVTDPILTLGGLISSGVDAKDRGIEYFWTTVTSGSVGTSGSKLGWFGLKRDTGRFSFIPDAVNNSEVVSGALGDIEARNIYSQNFVFNSAGQLSMACGSIVDVKTIRGCGSLFLESSDSITVRGTNGILLDTTQFVRLENNTPLQFGTSGTTIRSDGTNGTLRLSGTTIIASTGSVVLPTGSRFSLDGTTSGSIGLRGTEGNLIVSASNDIRMMPSSGNVLLDDSKAIIYGGDSNRIFGSGSTLVVTGSSTTEIRGTTVNVVSTTLNLSSGTISIPSNTVTRFGTSGSLTTTSGTTGGLILSGTSGSTFTVNNFSQIDLKTPTVNIDENSRLNLGANYIRTTGGTLELVQIGTTGNIALRNNTSSITIDDTVVNVSSDSINLRGEVAITDSIVDIASSDSRLVDRGIQFTSNSTGKFFGYKESTDRFTFYSASTNVGDIISGTLGNIEASSLFSREIVFTTRGNLDLGCGTIRRVTRIESGTEGSTCNSIVLQSATTVDILSSGETTVSSASIRLSAQTGVRLNESVPLQFGTTGSIVSSSGKLLTAVGNNRVSMDTMITEIRSSVINLESEFVQIADPVIRLGKVNSTNIDRGFEFVKESSGSTGFIGYKNNSDSFVYYKESFDTGTEILGTLGNLEVGNIRGSNLSLRDGIISSDTNLSLVTTAGNINMSPSEKVTISDGKTIQFGTGTSGSVSIGGSGGTMFLNADRVSMEAINIGESSISVSGGGLAITTASGTSGGINLDTSKVTIPEGSPLQFGNENIKIYSDAERLYIDGYRGTIFSGDDVTFLGDLNIVGNFTSTNIDTDVIPFIYPLGTNHIVDIVSITQPTSGRIQITTDAAHLLAVGDQINIKNTNSEPDINGTYTVSDIINSTTFRVSKTIVLTTPGTNGKIIGSLVTDPGKDVGIQVNWHTGTTTGTSAGRTGFFGFKRQTERWTFYRNGTVTDNVFNGTLGNIEASKGFFERLSGFVLDGAVTAGSNAVIGSNFQISGGSIDSTPIGVNTANVGRFTNLTSTVQTNVNNQTVTGRMAYSAERFTVSSTNSVINPSNIHMVTFVSVSGISFGGSGTMPNGTVDGQTKTVVISSMGSNCTYTLNFASGKLMAPNPLNPSTNPTKILFKRRGQSITLIWDDISQFWVPCGGNGGYIS